MPWCAIVDPRGQVLITTDGPEGNIGYPAEAAEIEHFVTMLTKTARHLREEDIRQLAAALQAAGQQ